MLYWNLPKVEFSLLLVCQLQLEIDLPSSRSELVEKKITKYVMLMSVIQGPLDIVLLCLENPHFSSLPIPISQTFEISSSIRQSLNVCLYRMYHKSLFFYHGSISIISFLTVDAMFFLFFSWSPRRV